MQNERDDQYRNYDDNSRNNENNRKDIIGYSAIPGPSFDAGRYGTDQNRSYDHDKNRDTDQNWDRSQGIIKRHFDVSADRTNQYSPYSSDRSGAGNAQFSGAGDYSYDMSRDFRSNNRQRYYDNDRAQGQGYPENRRMSSEGGWDKSGNVRQRTGYGREQAESMPVRTAYERYHGHGKADRTNDWMRDMDRDRDYRRSSGNSSVYGSGYTGPNYGSIQTGGRFDNDRDFTSGGYTSDGYTSGGISNMGGDYDRERTRGRQYRDNYDSAGRFGGDYNRNQYKPNENEGGSYRYDSGFTFGGGTPNRDNTSRSHDYEDRDRNYSNQSQNRSGESHWGGRFGNEQEWNGNSRSNYGSSGSDHNQWRENRSQQQGQRHSHNPSDPSQYRNHTTQTGNPDYDRGNFRAADYVYNRHGQQEEDRGFFEKAGERVRSWFGGHDDHDRNRY